MKIINSLNVVMLYVGMVVVAALMLLTVSDVSGRYFFTHPIMGTTEISEFLMACLLVGMAPCALAGRHIRIDIIFQRFKPKVQAVLDSIYLIFGMGAVAILTWTGFKQGLVMLKAGAASTTLYIPKTPFMMLLVASFAMLFLFMVVLLVKRIGEVVKK